MKTMTEMSKEYATALFMLSREVGREKEYLKALNKVMAAFDEEPDYLEFLSSPAIPVKERLTAIESAFATLLPEHVLSFLQLLCEKGRIRGFKEAVEEYDRLLDAFENISVAKVKSAVALTDKEQERLVEKLEKMCGHTVTLVCEVDESLMGGIIVEVDGKVMDGSLRSRLHEVKDVISR